MSSPDRRYGEKNEHKTNWNPWIRTHHMLFGCLLSPMHWRPTWSNNNRLLEICCLWLPRHNCWPLVTTSDALVTTSDALVTTWEIDRQKVDSESLKYMSFDPSVDMSAANESIGDELLIHALVSIAMDLRHGNCSYESFSIAPSSLVNPNVVIHTKNGPRCLRAQYSCMKQLHKSLTMSHRFEGSVSHGPACLALGVVFEVPMTPSYFLDHRDVRRPGFHGSKDSQVGLPRCTCFRMVSGCFLGKHTKGQCVFHVYTSWSCKLYVYKKHQETMCCLAHKEKQQTLLQVCNF